MLQRSIQLPDGSNAPLINVLNLTNVPHTALLGDGVPDQNRTVSFDVYRRAMGMLSTISTYAGAIAGATVGAVAFIAFISLTRNQASEYLLDNPTASAAINVTTVLALAAGGALIGRGLFARARNSLNRQIAAERADEAPLLVNAPR